MQAFRVRITYQDGRAVHTAPLGSRSSATQWAVFYNLCRGFSSKAQVVPC